MFRNLISAGILATALASGADATGKWTTIRSDSGDEARYMVIGLADPTHSQRALDIAIYKGGPGAYDPEALRRVTFDCAGHFWDSTGPGVGPIEHTSPHSFEGAIASAVCPRPAVH